MAKAQTLTKADINELKSEVASEVVRQLVPQVKTTFSLVITQELSEQEEKYEKKLTEFKSEFFERVDPVLKEVLASREERSIIAHHIAELRNRVEKIEKRLGISA